MNRDEVCCLTPAGSSAIAVVGLRGPTVWSKVSPYFQSDKRQTILSATPQTFLGKLHRDGIGDEIVLVLSGDENHQDIELQLHGGPGIVSWCLQFAEDLGCERLEWQDWWSTPLWNLLPQATTKKTAGILLDQCQGALDRAMAEIQKSDTDPVHQLAAVDELLSWSSLGAHLVKPWKIVLAGPPNVGKSSLLNALLGYERAITSPVPGTTRDLVTAAIAWNGYPLELTDTAGLREQGDAIESAGMEHTRSAAQAADLVVWLIDLNQAETILSQDIASSIIVGTKADLPRLATMSPVLTVSAQQGTGLSELLTAILKRLVPVEPGSGQAMPVLTAQIAQLRQLRAEIAHEVCCQ